MLERKLSEQNLQDPKRIVPGERALTFSELLAKCMCTCCVLCTMLRTRKNVVTQY